MKKSHLAALVAGLTFSLFLSPVFAAEADPAKGERLYKQRCLSCHSLDESGRRVGPHLAQLIGRAAGSVDGFRYSKAMSNADFVWTSENLDPFLADPRKVIPGTTMVMRVSVARDRANLIAYFEGLQDQQGE